MFNFFKKEKKEVSTKHPSFELELTAAVLAYEIARSDGEISDDELLVCSLVLSRFLLNNY